MPPPGFAPPLVLLPGTLCDERVFTPLLAHLTKSFHPETICALIVMTPQHDDLRAAAEAVLGVAPPRFALLGFSLGGLIALEVALLAPERLVGLALLNVNPSPVPPTQFAARRQAVLEAKAAGHGRFLRETLWRSYVAPSHDGDDSVRQTLSEMAEGLGHRAFHNQTEAALTRRDLRPLLPIVSAHTLVVAGEHDSICPAALQREMAASLPDAQFSLIPNAGHFALMEEEDAVARSVAAWFHHITADTRWQNWNQQALQESR